MSRRGRTPDLECPELFRLVFVERPPGWRPRGYFDAPDVATIVMADGDHALLHRGEAAAQVLACNYQATKQEAPIWAALVEYGESIEIGKTCTQFCTQIRS